MTFFSHRPCFQTFHFFFRFSLSLLCENVVYYPFFTRKTSISEKNSLITPFFTRFLLSRASDNTSQNIGGTDAWPVPNLKSCGGRPPVPYVSAHCWIDESIGLHV